MISFKGAHVPKDIILTGVCWCVTYPLSYMPGKIPIDGSAASEAAIKSYNAQHGRAIAIRQIKYLNNTVEQGY
jgi:transposase-like protein